MKGGKTRQESEANVDDAHKSAGPTDPSRSRTNKGQGKLEVAQAITKFYDPLDSSI